MISRLPHFSLISFSETASHKARSLLPLVCFIDLFPDDLITSQLLLGSGFINSMEVYDSQDQKADAD